jgi:hypothetical protein
MKLFGFLAVLLLSACGSSPYPDATHALTFLDCANTFQNGQVGGIAGTYNDPSTSTRYLIGQDCTLQAPTIDSCQTIGRISANRTGGMSQVQIGQSKAMAGCLPVGAYSCNFIPSGNNLTVDCGANGVLNLNKL